MKRSLSLLSLFAFSSLHGEPLFEITRHPYPLNVDPQIGGIDVMPDGRIAAAFHRGEVLIYNPADKSWTEFARGLHEPLGLVVDGKDFLVMQRPELTRISDTDGDGTADSYQTVSDKFGISGNYHEFAFGPARGPDGDLYISLNVASNGAGIREEVRGEWSEIGQLDQEQMKATGSDWQAIKKNAGRMYSRVPYRGWILKISPDGTTTPFACGFRSPDGIGFDSEGNLLVTDNQGDWRGTSPLYTVKKDHFYGHPASLPWRSDWDGRDPLQVPLEELQSLRTPASALMPQGELANSPTQPIAIPESWGPYGGQVLFGDMNQPRLLRFLADEVNGFPQGALLPFVEQPEEIETGSHRFAFDKQGTLWIGKTHLSWGGGTGLLSIKPPAADIFTVTSCHLGKKDSQQQLTLTFSQILADNLKAPAIKRYRYNYYPNYGSPKEDEAKVPVTKIELMEDQKTLVLTLEIKKGFLHELDLSQLVSQIDQPLEGQRLYYNAVEIPQ